MIHAWSVHVSRTNASGDSGSDVANETCITSWTMSLGSSQNPRAERGLIGKRRRGLKFKQLSVQHIEIVVAILAGFNDSQA